MKAPFVFRMKHNFILAALSAMFTTKNMPRNIDPEGSSNKSGGSQPRGHRISKKERKRRERIRRINPNRKH